MRSDLPRVVLDTNILVASGFNRRSRSARLVEQIRAGEVLLVWDDATLAETRKIIRQIPVLRWEAFEDLFNPEGHFTGLTDRAAFQPVADPDDRKFAALAAAAEAVLITNDDHLLSVRGQLGINVQQPEEYYRPGSS